MQIASERSNLVRSLITNLESKSHTELKLKELTDEVKDLSAKLLPEISGQLSKLGIAPKFETAQQIEITYYFKFNGRVNLTELSKVISNMESKINAQNKANIIHFGLIIRRII